MTPPTKILLPHQERVVTERHELIFKLDRLVEFLKGDLFKTLSVDEQERLTRQSEIMQKYSEVLAERIVNF